MEDTKNEISLILAKIFAKREYLFFDKNTNFARNCYRRFGNLQIKLKYCRDNDDIKRNLSNSIRTIDDVLISEQLKDEKKPYLEDCKEKLELILVMVELTGGD